MRERTQQARDRGYADYGHTPEYKAEQRRKKAALEGREYRTTFERMFCSDLRTELKARLAAVLAKPRLSPEETRKRINERFRERYWAKPEVERSRTINYKSRNWDRKRQWDAVREQRMRLTSDGTATKQTDHVVPATAGVTACRTS